MTKAIGPADIGRHPTIIKKAQEEIAKMDVLVCGKCHKVFHFIEEFKPHKDSNCRGPAAMKDCKETKPKIWAFLLWKGSQQDTAENIWKMYQRWIKVDDTTRDTWISAGSSLQSLARVNQGTLQEVVSSTSTKIEPIKVESPVNQIKRGVEVRSINNVSSVGKKENAEEPPKKLVPIRSPVKSIMAAAPKGGYMARRTMNTIGNKIEVREMAVDKLVGKRFMPRQKNYVYQVKWMNPNMENTWEPLSHLQKCGPLIDILERTLQQQQSKNQEANDAAGRPVRNSKAKALDQVKQWCADEDGGGAGGDLKRKLVTDGGDSSQDELGSPSPKKQFKSESPGGAQTTVLRTTVAKALPKVESNLKSPVNGAASPKNSAEVVIATAKDKQSGVVRKPGAVVSAGGQKEAQIKVVGKNDSTSSGIVRIGAEQAETKAATVPKLVQSPAGTTTTQRVVTTPALRAIQQGGSQGQQQIYSRTVTKPGGQVVRQIIHAQPSPRAQQQQQVVRRTVVGAGAAQKQTASPATTTTRLVRSAPSSKAGTPVQQKTTQVVRRTVGGNPPSLAKIGSPSPPRPLTLCPITGKVLSRAEGEAETTVSSGIKKEAKKEETMQIQTEDGQIQQLYTNEDGSPLLVTGEDGTIYQVAGKTADGQTLLIAQGADGEQQCVYVEDGDESGLMALTQGAAQAGAAAEAQEAEASAPMETSQEEGGQAEGEGESAQQQLSIDTDSQDGQITAELIQADQPSPGGTRRVVLMLPDGQLMVTDVDKEQYEQFTMGG